MGYYVQSLSVMAVLAFVRLRILTWHSFANLVGEFLPNVMIPCGSKCSIKVSQLPQFQGVAPQSKKGSDVWRSTVKIGKIALNNTKRIVGDVTNLSFWHDWWCGYSPFGENLLDFPSDQLADYISISKEWGHESD